MRKLKHKDVLKQPKETQRGKGESGLKCETGF